VKNADDFDPMAGKGEYAACNEDRAALRRFHSERYAASAHVVLAHGTVYDFAFAHARQLDWNAIVLGLSLAGFLAPGPTFRRASFWHVRPEFASEREECARRIEALVGIGWRLAVEHVILRGCRARHRPLNGILHSARSAKSVGTCAKPRNGVKHCFRFLERRRVRRAASARRLIGADLPDTLLLTSGWGAQERGSDAGQHVHMNATSAAIIVAANDLLRSSDPSVAEIINHWDAVLVLLRLEPSPEGRADLLDVAALLRSAWRGKSGSDEAFAGYALSLEDRHSQILDERERGRRERERRDEEGGHPL
jgi:hypothetical protein